MMILRPIEIMNILQACIASEFTIRGKRGPLPHEIRDSTRRGAATIEEFALSLELPVTANTARILMGRAETSEELHHAIRMLSDNLFMELDQRKFYGPVAKFSNYFEQPKLFGDDVFTKLASANNDIYEAGTCLALERGTACVMHLMRVMEAGLAALAKTVGVAKQNDWGRYLSEIEKELSSRYRTSGARTPDEQFYAEAAMTFDQVRRAWRNPTMHVEHNYSSERAQEILEAVKSFMNHLATKISE